MARRTYDPLGCIPAPDAVRDKLTETLTLAERLRILLALSEQIHATPRDTSANPTGAPRAEVAAHV